MTDQGAVPPGYLEQLRRMMREEIAAYARSGSSRNMSIGEGGALTIRGGLLQILHPIADGGGVGAYFGPQWSAGDGSYQGTGILVQDSNGADIFTARSDQATGNPICIVWDAAQHAVIATDGSGQGLGRPHIPFVFYSARYTDTPQVTTAGSFETLWTASCYKVNPAVYVAAAAVSDVGTTGEVRVLVNGAQIDVTGNVTSVSVSHAFGPDVVAGDPSTFLTIEIQARVTSGAGAVRVAPQIGSGWSTT